MTDQRLEFIEQCRAEVAAIGAEVANECSGSGAPIDIVVVMRHADGRIAVHRSSGNLASHLGMLSIAEHTLLKGTEVQSSPSGAR